MNAYLISSSEVDVLQEYIAGHARYEPEILVDVVFAHSRAGAKYLFRQRHRMDIEWMDIKHVHLLARDVDREHGIAKHDDAYWNPEQWTHATKRFVHSQTG